MRIILLKSLMEDWKFIPPGTHLDIHDEPKRDKTGNMPDYKITTDASVKKTNKVQRRYHAKNRKSDQTLVHFDKPENMPGP